VTDKLIDAEQYHSARERGVVYAMWEPYEDSESLDLAQAHRISTLPHLGTDCFLIL